MATTSTNTSKRASKPAPRSIADIARETATTRRPRSRKKTLIGIAVEQKYVDRKQAATYLAVSTGFVIQLVKEGMLPEYDLGPFCKRYLITDLEAYCQSRRKGPASVPAVLA